VLSVFDVTKSINYLEVNLCYFCNWYNSISL